MTILTFREFSKHEIDSSLFLENDQLSVRSDIQHLFTFQFRNGRLEIQPHGRVGLIPLNSHVTVDVQPRIDLDLARILLISGTAPALLPDVMRGYSTHGQLLPSLLRLYAESLERAVLQIVEHGFINRYRQVEEVTSSVSGRILMDRTMRRMAAKGSPHIVEIARFEKVRDNDINSLLVESVHSLKDAVDRSGEAVSSADRIAISRALNHCLLRLAPATPLARKRFGDRYWHHGTLRFPPAHRHYENAVSISRAILESCGVSFSRDSGPLGMGTIVIDTAAAFECYVRKLLAGSSRDYSSVIEVVDGNLSPQAGGGKRPLFDDVQSRAVTPDIVFRDVRDNSKFPLVGDVKYKPIESGLGREDLNQILVYALAYHSPRALIVHLRPDKGMAGLAEIGTIRGITVFCYSLDVSEAAIRDQESRFCERIFALCRE